jgi:RNA ligase (TIGR02306 family)
MERKLASIQRILDIQPIEGANKIVRAQINGWWVVTAIDNGFKVGDDVIYFEIDSWIPHKLAPFLSKGHEPREFEGVKGERLRTIRLRGQISQGLIMPIEVCKEYDLDSLPFGTLSTEGADLTDFLGIKKWEKPMNAQLQGICRGNFPSFLRKTNQERVQNILHEINSSYEQREEFEVTEKLDGSSMTVYRNTEYVTPGYDETAVVEEITIGVCSRNLDLKIDQEGNSFVNMAKSSGLIEAITKLNRNIAVQGELYGEGIQGNNEGIVGHKFAVFDIFDIDTQEYLLPEHRAQVFFKLKELGADIDHVPGTHDFVLNSADINDLLKMAEAKNAAGNEREGLVFKSNSRNFSFKAISNKFLLSGGD